MLYKSIAVAALSVLSGLTTAAPTAFPVTPLPASPDLQNSIIALQANLVLIINDYVQSNALAARNDYYDAQRKIITLGQAVTAPAGYSCPSPPSTGGRIETRDAAIAALYTVQTDLMQISLDLMDVNSSGEKLNGDFCKAYGGFQGVDYYTFNKVGA